MNTEAEAAPASARGDDAGRLRELARVFLWLGTVAFGGPAAHIAMMREELVERRRWLKNEQFLDLLSAANLIPGPNSTELAIHIGFERARFRGLAVAGGCFIAPAMLITGLLGFVYVTFQQRPELESVFYGIKPVIVAVVAHAIYNLAPAAARHPQQRWYVAFALLLAALGVHEIGVLIAGGGFALLTTLATRERHLRMALPVLSLLPAAGAPLAAESVSPFSLFTVFLKIGSVLYGSGYVLLSFLRAELVERLGWMSEGQVLDAIAIGQVTPGPVFTTATFIGYVLAGPAGALTATLGIFLPAFLFVAVSGPLVPRLRASKRAGTFLDGVNSASLALMIVVTVQLARAAVVDVTTALLALVSLGILLSKRVNSTWVLAGGAAVGVARALFSRLGGG